MFACKAIENCWKTESILQNTYLYMFPTILKLYIVCAVFALGGQRLGFQRPNKSETVAVKNTLHFPDGNKRIAVIRNRVHKQIGKHVKVIDKYGRIIYICIKYLEPQYFCYYCRRGVSPDVHPILDPDTFPAGSLYSFVWRIAFVCRRKKHPKCFTQIG